MSVWQIEKQTVLVSSPFYLLLSMDLGTVVKKLGEALEKVKRKCRVGGGVVKEKPRDKDFHLV